ncbi:hypothetical protein cand_019480 [Cryptosporidium andersoni]|uniref:TAF6 C-terminal HEAT repeat domain-containing protein n=1 Tax=Cryptosporidium andersoni TaxID=117008 RepID=A0A1J4MSV0_9CRYT|nr:hypothetical protein cand_019480 [Cryptosporidium andersoni]
MTDNLNESNFREYIAYDLDGIIPIGSTEIDNKIRFKEITNKRSLEYSQGFKSLSAYDFVFPLSKQLCSDSITKKAADIIMEIVEFRLRQILQDSIKYSFKRGGNGPLKVYSNYTRKNLLYISLNDLKSAIICIPGLPNVISKRYSAKQSKYCPYITCNSNPKYMITETNKDAFRLFPGRVAEYFVYFRKSNVNLNLFMPIFNIDENKSSTNNELDFFHSIILQMDNEIPIEPILNIHWLAVDGKFVSEPNNDFKYISNYLNKNKLSKSNSIIAIESVFYQNILYDSNISENMKILINQGLEGSLPDEQKDYLIYLTKLFRRGFEGYWYNSWILNYKGQKCLSNKLCKLRDLYGLSEKDLDSISSILTIDKSSNFKMDDDHEYNEKQLEILLQKQLMKDNGNIQNLTGLELYLKIERSLNRLESSTMLEPLLSHLINFIYYNTYQLCNNFKNFGILLPAGSIRLIIRIINSLISNQYCSNITLYIHLIAESLLKIIIVCPIKYRECYKNNSKLKDISKFEDNLTNLSNMQISTFMLIDNILARQEAAQTLEHIIILCKRILPIGGNKLVNKLYKFYQEFLIKNVSCLSKVNIFEIAAIYGVIWGIKGLGEIAIFTLLLPRLPIFLSFYPDNYDMKVCYSLLHTSLISIISNMVNSISNIYNNIKDHFTNILLQHWVNIINKIFQISGDSVIPIFMAYYNNNQYDLQETVCFLNNCLFNNSFDNFITCPISKKTSKLQTATQLCNEYFKRDLPSEQEDTNSKFIKDNDIKYLTSSYLFLIL